MAAQRILSSASAAADFVTFVNRAASPYHAVSVLSERLVGQGFTQLREGDDWAPLKPGDRCFVTRSESSLVAFVVGGKFSPGSGFKIVGAHTDSPNLAVKPKSKSRKAGFVEIGVQTYGGGLWHTWFDRDLTVAGRVIVQTSSDSPITSRLVHIKRPIMRVPNLAIHLTTAKERESGFAPNKESHVTPVVALEGSLSEANDTPDGQCPLLMKLLCDELALSPEQVIDFDLSIVDTQPATLGGAAEEFVFSPRIDNLLSCHCAVEALLSTISSQSEDSMVRVVACFDHEEVGSSSAAGAGGSMMNDIMDRVLSADVSQRSRSVANSFLLPVDGAHGVHPNYADRHEVAHRPVLHAGPVIKYNANQRYSTTGETAAIIATLAKSAGVPIQKVCVKNDSPCGSTIGPILTALSGIKGADIGNAMLSMHSIREMCGTVDIPLLTRLIGEFFVHYNDIKLA